jgi:hypothetical protein
VKWAAGLDALAPGILGSNQPIVAGNGVIVLATFVPPVPGQGSVTSLTEFSTVDGSVVWTRNFGDQSIDSQLFSDNQGHLYYSLQLGSHLC